MCAKNERERKAKKRAHGRSVFWLHSQLCQHQLLRKTRFIFHSREGLSIQSTANHFCIYIYQMYEYDLYTYVYIELEERERGVLLLIS